MFYAYYAALYGPVAITISFLPLWIRSNGLTEQQVGQLFAVGALIKLVVNPIVGLVADASESRKNVLLSLVAMSCILALLLQHARVPAWVFYSFIVLQACSAAVVPLSESIVLGNASRLGLDFGRLRSIGSVSVAVITVALGAALDWVGLEFVALALTLCYLILGVIAIGLPDFRAVRTHSKASLLQLLRQKAFILFLCSAAVSQACHGLFYVYSAILWKSLGLSSTSIGALWSFGVLVEVLVFVFGSRILALISAPTLVLLACIGGVVRWTLLAEAGDLGTLVVVQALQAATLSCTQVGAAEFIKTNVRQQAMSTGTGIYWGTVGVLTSAIVYGGSYLYSTFEGRAFFLSAVLCLGATVSAALLRHCVIPACQHTKS
ncbi:MAG: MFS transporter [Ramlibacter sp.]|nr:MFS transporter [Ramlibacter sp.]